MRLNHSGVPLRSEISNGRQGMMRTKGYKAEAPETRTSAEGKKYMIKPLFDFEENLGLWRSEWGVGWG